MTEKELFERWSALETDYDKSVFNECVCLCNFMNDGDFYFYQNPDEATEAEFMSVLDFLHYQGCYMLLYRFLRDNGERLLYPEFKEIENMELRDGIKERLEKAVLREMH